MLLVSISGASIFTRNVAGIFQCFLMVQRIQKCAKTVLCLHGKRVFLQKGQARQRACSDRRNRRNSMFAPQCIHDDIWSAGIAAPVFLRRDVPRQAAGLSKLFILFGLDI